LRLRSQRQIRLSLIRESRPARFTTIDSNPTHECHAKGRDSDPIWRQEHQSSTNQPTLRGRRTSKGHDVVKVVLVYPVTVFLCSTRSAADATLGWRQIRKHPVTSAAAILSFAWLTCVEIER